ncbi:hypothetical protein Halha_0408 [Halobacteroides halobius DSM 5150]|uniref:Lipoprotein n=1 Tax=Halobacteroides halobius (strain ATCC 35273 / DSM 5150 / MD-1) TaxID=748449 RepID=L0K8F5_HALHC|nr:hypothetical protein [Halobacteroides halobius]AGB40403.1 hypothetical protein Halha_0408 [Halobacteroides halobius DSM 5150]
MKKFLSLSLVFLLSLVVLTGCGGNQPATNQGQPKKEADTVTAASITGKEAVFRKAVSEKGTWIVAALNDLTFDEELVIAGTFHDKGKASNEVYRKIAPYTQDDSYNVTERYTITAPKFIVKSPNAKFQGGIFAGDVYVKAKGFTIDDATVKGNVYFAKEEYKSSFTTEAGGKVTGVTKVKGKADVVTAASITGKEAVFRKAVSEKGTWIVAALNDLTFDEELVIAGTFHDKGKASNEVYRKIAPYTQDDSYNVTERYTITAPKFIVKSPNTKFQGGIFAGDVYVKAKGFTIDDATVKGNVYFAKEEYKSSFTTEAGGKVTGVTKVKGKADVVTAASITGKEAVFRKAVSEKGTWIVAALNDLTFDEELVIAGTFHDKGKASNEVYRKIAPYTQDDSYNVTERYTITAPKFIVKSPNAKFQGGIFAGDVYVKAKGFTIDDATVKGNVYFAKEEYKSSFTTEAGGKVTGVSKVK